MTEKKPEQERRRFERVPFKAKFDCQYFFDAEISEITPVESTNISQAGILVKTTEAIPLGATITFQVERKNLQGKVDISKLQSYIEIDLQDKSFVKMCGKVVRIEEKSPNTYFIAVHLINK